MTIAVLTSALSFSSSFKLVVVATLISTTVGLHGQSIGEQVSAQELVRKAVENETAPSDKKRSNWSFTKKIEKPGRVEERLVIQTTEGDVDRLITVNGKALTESADRKERERIQSLARDPSRQAQLRKANKEDSDRIDRIMKLFPDALVFTYGARRGRSVQLLFEPNPRFHPQSREAHVLNSLAGEIWINDRNNQSEEAKGRLIHDVHFGGGIAGRLAKGGHFEVRKTEVAPGDWQLSFLDVRMHGKALLFKSISIQETETHTHFRRVADDLTLAQAAAMLSRQDVVARFALLP